MNILLTGGFGNVGRSTLDELIAKGYNVTVFELQTKANVHYAKHHGGFKTIWGDLEAIREAMQGQDVIIHTAAIIPPLADKNPGLSYKVNVEGTQNLVNAAGQQQKTPRIIYTSSISVYGDRVDSPNICVADPVNPNLHDKYAQHKLEAEGIIKSSGLEWAIFRLSYIVSADKLKMDPLMFEMPLNTSLEPCHTKDAGLALANAVESKEVYGKVLHIAGGKGCRITYREYLDKMFELFGFGKGFLPESAFKKSGFHCGFMDTKNSQRLLNYQYHTLEDYFNEVSAKLAMTRFFIKMGGKFGEAIAREYILKRARA